MSNKNNSNKNSGKAKGRGKPRGPGELPEGAADRAREAQEILRERFNEHVLVHHDRGTLRVTNGSPNAYIDIYEDGALYRILGWKYGERIDTLVQQDVESLDEKLEELI